MRDMTRELLIRASRPMHMTRTRGSSAPALFTLCAIHAFLIPLSDVSARLAANGFAHPSLLPSLFTFLRGTKNFALNRPHLTRDIVRRLDAIKFKTCRIVLRQFREIEP